MDSYIIAERQRVERAVGIYADLEEQLQPLVDNLEDLLEGFAQLDEEMVEDIREVVSNIEAILAATQHADNAEDSAERSEIWAEGTDNQVSNIGGTKSSRGWAIESENSMEIAASYSNYQGRWNNAEPGPVTKPIAFLHNGLMWGLAVEQLQDVTQSEPSMENDDWTLLSPREVAVAGGFTQIDSFQFQVGNGVSVCDTGIESDVIVFVNGAQQAKQNYTKVGTILTILEEIEQDDEIVVVRFTPVEDLEGPKGDAATVGVGTVTTIEPGDQAVVTNSGTEHDAVFNFRIPRGQTGIQGDVGEQGESAYQVWLDHGNTGSIEDYLETLKGDKGDTGEKGDTGDQGEQGDQGDSAYQVWLNDGNSGTIEDYLESLKGEKGDKGEKGEDGPMFVLGTMLPDQEASPATENQTTFGGFSADPAMSLVMVNRIEQESDTYTFDGNQIIFNEGLSVGDIVRVRQWRTQVSFEDLPDVETLSAEDKIPVQTSGGSGVVRPINVYDAVYSKYRVEDMVLYPWGTTATGDASGTDFRDLYNYIGGEGGADVNSTISRHAGYRHGYRVNTSNENNIPSRAERTFYLSFSLQMQGDSIFRFNTCRYDERLTGLNSTGWGIEIRDGGSVFLQLHDNTNLTELHAGYILPIAGNTYRWRLHFDLKNETYSLYDLAYNVLLGELSEGFPLETGNPTILTANAFLDNNGFNHTSGNSFKIYDLKHVIEI